MQDSEDPGILGQVVGWGLWGGGTVSRPQHMGSKGKESITSDLIES